MVGVAFEQVEEYLVVGGWLLAVGDEDLHYCPEESAGVLHNVVRALNERVFVVSRILDKANPALADTLQDIVVLRMAQELRIVLSEDPHQFHAQKTLESSFRILVIVHWLLHSREPGKAISDVNINVSSDSLPYSKRLWLLDDSEHNRSSIFFTEHDLSFDWLAVEVLGEAVSEVALEHSKPDPNWP